MSQTASKFNYLYKDPSPAERSRKRRSLVIWIGGALFTLGLSITIIFTIVLIYEAAQTLHPAPKIISPIPVDEPYQARLPLQSDSRYNAMIQLQLTGNAVQTTSTPIGERTVLKHELRVSCVVKDTDGIIIHTEEILLTPNASLQANKTTLTPLQDGSFNYDVEYQLPSFAPSRDDDYTIQITIHPSEKTRPLNNAPANINRSNSDIENPDTAVETNYIRQAQFQLNEETNEKSTGVLGLFLLLGLGAILGLLIGLFGGLLSMIGLILGANRLKHIVREELARIPRS